MRDFRGNLTFDPRMPRGFQRLRFALQVRGCRLVVDMAPDKATYLLEMGDSFEIEHQGNKLKLTRGEPAEMPIKGLPGRGLNGAGASEPEDRVPPNGPEVLT